MRLPWKFILISFVIGLLAGGSIGLYNSHRLAHEWIKKAPQLFLRRLDHELHLDETQKTQILAILNARRDKLLSYQEELRLAARADIRTHLTPSQQTQFDAMIAKRDAERRKRDGQ
jgi:hypothetical protein